MKKRVLIPIPSQDFDPTETAVPWKILTVANVSITFATPEGIAGICDQKMLSGKGLGPFSKILASDERGNEAYLEMHNSTEFKNPIRWTEINPEDFDGMILPGGHAKGMIEYLESKLLQSYIVKFFEMSKPVGSICHGVVLASRSRNSAGKSVLFGRKTTALLSQQELLAWILTRLWLGNYYRTYSQTVEAEVKLSLASGNDFSRGPLPLFRDSLENLNRGFMVKDGNYISARWPGDAHLFATEFLKMLS